MNKLLLFFLIFINSFLFAENLYLKNESSNQDIKWLGDKRGIPYINVVGKTVVDTVYINSVITLYDTTYIYDTKFYEPLIPDTVLLKTDIIYSDSITEDLSIDTLNLSYIKFDTSLNNINNVAGEINYSSEEGTYNFGMNGGNVIGNLFLETFYRIKNQSGNDILNGSVVSYNGTLGLSGVLLGENAIGGVSSAYLLGIATEDITNNSFGFVTHFGKVRGINTTGSIYGETWADSDILYYNFADSGLTNVQPSNEYPLVMMAVVVNTHATNGELFVRPTIVKFERTFQKYAVSTKTDTYTLTYNDNHIIVDNEEEVSITLPSPTNYSGLDFFVKTLTDTTVYILGNGVNIDESDSFLLDDRYMGATFFTDGTNWYIK